MYMDRVMFIGIEKYNHPKIFVKLWHCSVNCTICFYRCESSFSSMLGRCSSGCRQFDPPPQHPSPHSRAHGCGCSHKVCKQSVVYTNSLNTT
jgi:hypothetical protein